MGGGHYTAVCRNSRDRAWYSFNDGWVSPTSPEAAVNEQVGGDSGRWWVGGDSGRWWGVTVVGGWCGWCDVVVIMFVFLTVAVDVR